MKERAINLSICTVILCMAIAVPSSAQVSLNGSLDFVMGGGGEEVTFAATEMPYDFYHGHLAIQEFHLFGYAPVGEWSNVEMEILSDLQGDGRLRAPRFGILAFNWTPDPGLFSLSLGRIPTPFGIENSKLIPHERTFLTRPLAYSWLLDLSDTRGYWPSAGSGGIYGVDDVGVTALGFEGLSTGLRMDWATTTGGWEWMLAITDATPSTSREWTNAFTYAATARLVHHLNDDVSHGLSVCWGSWMSQDPELVPLLGNPTKYRQTLLGLDGRYDWKPIEIVWEALASRWSAPRYGDTTFVPVNVAGTTPATTIPLLATGWVDVIWHFNESHGGYAAGRWDMLRPFVMNDPGDGSSTIWEMGVNRWSFAAGWSLTKSIHTKFSYSNQTLTLEHGQTHDWTARLLLSVLF